MAVLTDEMQVVEASPARSEATQSWGYSLRKTKAMFYELLVFPRSLNTTYSDYLTLVTRLYFSGGDRGSFPNRRCRCKFPSSASKRAFRRYGTSGSGVASETMDMLHVVLIHNMSVYLHV